MQTGLSTPIVIVITVCLFLLGMLLSIAPINAVKVLMIWPEFLRRILKIDFSQEGDETLDLLKKNPSAYQIKYKAQIDIFRVTGGIALLIGFATLCGLLQRLSQ